MSDAVHPVVEILPIPKRVALGLRHALIVLAMATTEQTLKVQAAESI